MVKPLVEKWVHPQHQSFNVKWYDITQDHGAPQKVTLRLHEEYEITLVDRCSGKRFVGNTIENFSQMDLFLIGPHLQHSIQLDAGEAGEVTTIHFLEHSFGKGFFNLPENAVIHQLLQDAKQGICFSRSTIKTSRGLLQKVKLTQGWERMMHLFQLLHQLAQATDYRKLSSQVFASKHNKKDHLLVNQTYEFIINRFHTQQISLGEISEHLNMSPATFCRYFKKHFHKTFTAFLNEVRIGHACKMLQETDRNIAEIAFASGYQQLTYFNRQFKKIIGVSPKVYRRELLRQSV